MLDTQKPQTLAIIGAGPAGLTLASLLNKRIPPSLLTITLFDLRSRPTASDLSKPSGSLDLHSESGLLALEKCGLLEQFQALASQDCTEQMIVADKNAKVVYRDGDEGDGDRGGDRPEIARNKLMSLLLDNVPENAVRWETKVLNISPSSSPSDSVPPNERKWTIRSTPASPSNAKGESSEDFDYIVGADGAWSKARAALAGDIPAPFYSGISYITLTLASLSTSYPTLVELLGSGSACIIGEGKMLMSQRSVRDSARIYVMLSHSSSSFLQDSGLSQPRNSEELKNKLLDDELFGTWGEKAKELIEAGCQSDLTWPLEARPLYMLPVGCTWTHTPSVTLIGDAAHLMTPFAGEGVNCAMLDAVELAEEMERDFVIGRSDAEEGRGEEAFARFENRMWARVGEVQQETWENLQMIFRDREAPRRFVEFMESHGPPPDE